LKYRLFCRNVYKVFFLKCFMDKRGVANWIWVIISAVFLIFAIWVIWGGDIASAFTSIDYDRVIPLGEFLEVTNDQVWGPVVTVVGYIVGGVPDLIAGGSFTDNKSSAVIVLIAIWLLIFVIFGDILRNFSSFSEPVAWTVAFLFGVIAANLKLVASVVAVLTGIFLPLGVLAAYAGLFASFVAFFAVEWGIKAWMPFVMRRKAAQQAIKANTATQSMLNAIRNYKAVGDELSQ